MITTNDYRYRVLWIDDKYEDQDGIIEDLAIESIEVIAVKTHLEGINELKKNINHYDAVILDALGYYESEEESEELFGLQESISELNSLKYIKVLPRFIFSAFMNKDGYEQARSIFKSESIFEKGTHNQQLIAAIKEAADKQVDTQIKYENSRFFKLLESYSEDHLETFLKIFRSLRSGAAQLDDKNYFTQIRILLEEMFHKALELGILHENCQNQNGKINLTDASLFLSGKDTNNSYGVRCGKVHFPKIVSDNVWSILKITGAGSHFTDPEFDNNIHVKQYRNLVNTPYLLYSLTFSVIDVIIWFDEYSKSNSDIDKNKSYWRVIDRYNEAYRGSPRSYPYKFGIVTRFDDKGNAWIDITSSHYQSVKVNSSNASNLSEGEEVLIAFHENQFIKDIQKLH